ncbi:efflux RND transporter permease subunit [Tepidibacillus marianensis]|uniref:efflux RND transporter permease subunit n=1 Tax=Tepidibacillus marianensis TaxID=3131995 RepID=UPI0030D1C571
MRFEGESKELSSGFSSMAIAMVIAVLLVYLVMLIGFGEMTAPIGILFSLPFIFVGGLWGLFFSGDSLGMPAMVGFLMLIGIVVTNAIVYMDRVMHNRQAGMSLNESLIEAGVTRLRPILMTALATVGALLPLAISTEGGLISRSMAIVVIAGLTTSTLLTLVIVPVAYMVLDGIRNRVFALGKSKSNPQIVGSISSMND